MFTERILLHVEPFLGVVLAVAQPMMPAARLKLPLCPLVLQRERAFPVGNPCFNGETQILRSAEAVEVIRHHKIITNKPSLRLRPSLMQKQMRRFVGKPRVALVGGDGEQNNVGLTEIDMNAGRWILPLWKLIVRGIVHEPDIIQTNVGLEVCDLARQESRPTGRAARGYARPTKRTRSLRWGERPREPLL